MRKSITVAICCAAVAGFTACIGGDTTSGISAGELDSQLRALILQNGLTGRPELLALDDGEEIPDVGDPLVRLGTRLFFSKSLGGNFTSSCASCHHPLLGGGDALTLPIGVDAEDPDLLGPGRVHDSAAPGFDGGPNVPRNSPTTFNTVLYRKRLFWDGRVQRLADGGIFTPDSTGPTAGDPNAGTTLLLAQARFPVTSLEEMRSFSFEPGSSRAVLRDHLGARIGDHGVGAGEIPDEWLPLFREAFDSPTGTREELIHYDAIAIALAAYQSSQLFVDNPWNRYVIGDLDALNAQQKRGALLFFREPQFGGAGCAICHSGDFFTDEEFHILAVPQVGRGKDDPNINGDPTHDWGRAQVSGAAEDKFAFRTQDLLNIEIGGPYGHDGAFDDLAGIIRHHLDPVSSVANYDWTQTDPGTQLSDLIVNSNEVVQGLLDARAAGRSKLPDGVALTGFQLADLIAFLHAMTDPRVKDPAALEPWIARDDAEFADSQLLDARFQE